MKLIYGSFEIEIKAKFKGERNSKEATMYVINDLISNLISASEYAEIKCYPVVAKSKKEKWIELFDQVEAMGYYKDKANR